ncbi:glycosyltransferase family 8 protein [Clostridium sp. C105KSO13]|uniref:glycosyltransferase family 8 protein n=1 Tax=Clostridium sp. C105KSO13 TaxID=1776045 RepID=UPI0007408735|nr:glycosyltransferase family 8 protein [Clostridium sp. C105KSO13]CUX24839.1 General stress protein A [Clostridium sp. C105KSO13]
MKKNKKIIPIFFTIDNDYAPFLGVALSSMLKNASKVYQYKVFVLFQGLSIKNKKKLYGLAVENCEIQLFEMKDQLNIITDRMSNRLRADYFTLTIYFRLFIPALFPEYNKGIYLDSDIVVPGDISELYQTPLGENLLGAVVDPVVAAVPELTRHANLCVGVESDKYFNSGVLLMNLERLREARIEQRFLELYHKYHFDCIAPDQDYLNAMCKGKVMYLPASWDAMPSDAAKPVENPKLVHFNLFAKPWYYDNIQYEQYFWTYAESSVFLKEIMTIKEAYTDKDRQSDREHLDLLVSRGNATGDGEVTFRTVFNEGKEARL